MRSEEAVDDDGAMQTVRVRPDKLLRFEGEHKEDGRVVWYVAYRGKYGWVACRGNGSYTSHPDEDDVLHSFIVYDDEAVVDRAETPDEVIL
jgi:hypothetical protein